MVNAEAASILATISSILDIQGENPFKVRAYQTAARTIESLEVPIGTLVEQKKLGELPGIGPAIEEKLTELHKTGKMKYFEDLRSSIPPGLLEMLRIPSLGPKKIKILWKDLGVTSIAQLEGRLPGREGGEAPGLRRADAGENPRGDRPPGPLEGALPREPGARRGAGAPRLPAPRGHRRGNRGQPAPGQAGGARRRHRLQRRGSREVIEHFARAPAVEEVIGKGDTKCSVRLRGGPQVDLRVVAEDEYAAALLYFTGSKEHNVLLRARAIKRGWTLNEYGLFKGKKRFDADSEEAIYKRLGLSYIPAELREGRDEIERAEKGELPQLIEPKDVKGILHVHTTWSDGTASIEEMAGKARRLGYKWMGLSDHSKAASYAHGLDEARLRKQMKEVAALNKGWKDFRILHGMELDILPNGDPRPFRRASREARLRDRIHTFQIRHVREGDDRPDLPGRRQQALRRLRPPHRPPAPRPRRVPGSISSACSRPRRPRARWSN